MRKEKDWELEGKKEKRRWFWTVIVLVVAIALFLGNTYYQKYFKKQTILEMVDTYINNFSADFYTKGYFSCPLDNKEVYLSEEEISSVIALFKDTYIKGVRDKEFIKHRKLNSYHVVLEDGFLESIVLFIGRDETSKKLVLSAMAENRYIAEVYIVEGEELIDMIANKCEKAP